MARRVFLHVGLPKSGTTFLQSLLLDHREQLADAGLLFPGEDGWKDQVRAVRDVRQMPMRSRRHRREVPGAWDRLAGEMREWPGDAVVSMEWLCRSEPEHIQRILRDLAPARVEVVFTLRDLARTIPASWQESIQNQNEWTWREFLDVLSTDDPDVPRPDRRFWKLHDAVALLGRWTAHVPVDRVHLITVPRAGAPPGLLWERFCGVVGVDPAQFPPVTTRRNESLGVVSTELVRLLTPRARAAGLSEETRQALVAQQLAKRGLSGRRSREPSLTIPGDLHDWVRERAEEEIAGIRAAGVHVVGDLDELRAELPDQVQAQPDELDDTTLLDAALDGLVIAVDQHAVAARHVAELTDELAAVRDRHARRLARRTRRLQRQRDRAVARLRRWESRPVRSAARLSVRRLPLAGRAARALRRRVGS